jgi:hypothetical protein
MNRKKESLVKLKEKDRRKGRTGQDKARHKDAVKRDKGGGRGSK